MVAGDELTTSMTVMQRKKENSLFSIVSKLRLTADFETSFANTLDEWVNEGKPVKRFDIINLVNYFHNRNNYHSALQKLVSLKFGFVNALVNDPKDILWDYEDP
ncbi:hypothetical protein Fot_33451 [Forsythia ovata]|uniref:RxLR effector protein n=1 Tax=Forsythia ovata TaxID=205694 RepID=A0ABD1TAQ3_9LAMI